MLVDCMWFVTGCFGRECSGADSVPFRIVGKVLFSTPSDEKPRPSLTIISPQITIPTKAYSQRRVGGPGPTTPSPAADTETNACTTEDDMSATPAIERPVVGDSNSTLGGLSSRLGYPPTSARARSESD